MYDKLIKDKIQESLLANKIIASIVSKLGSGDVLVDMIKEEIDSFLMEHDEIYKFSNFKDLMYQSFLELNKYRFANFIMNVVDNNPDKNRTYKHLLNDIQSKLHEKYNLPDDYYHMSKSQLDDVCDDLLLKENYFMLTKTRKFMTDNFRVFDYKSYIKENKDLALKVLRYNKLDDTNKTYLRIRKMLENNDGYLGLFTFFHFTEKITFIRLKILNKTINDNKQSVRGILANVSDYMKKTPYTLNGRVYNTNFEKLEDDITKILDEQKAKQFAGEYPAHLRRDLHRNEDYIEIIRELTVDTPEAKQKLDLYRTLFLKKVSKYHTQKELIDALIEFVYSANKNEDVQNICKWNTGVKMVYDNGDLTIVRVLSFGAMDEIANDTNWCIKSSISYWMSYVGDDNIQLIIIDSTKPSNSIQRKIGVTLECWNYTSAYAYKTGHLRNDNYVSEDYLTKLFEEYDLDMQTVFDLAREFGSNEQYSSDEVEDEERNRYGGN